MRHASRGDAQRGDYEGRADAGAGPGRRLRPGQLAGELLVVKLDRKWKPNDRYSLGANFAA